MNNKRCLKIILFLAYLLCSPMAVAEDASSLQSGSEDRLKQLYDMSYSQEAQKDYAGAIGDMLQAHAIAPGLDSSLRLGWLYYQAEEQELSLVYYKAALVFSPYSIDARLGMMLPLMALEKWQEARKFGEAVLSDDPGNVWANRYMGLVCYQVEDYKQAEQYYRQALEASPDDALMKLGLGLSLVRQERKEEGHLYCREAELSLPYDTRVEYCLTYGEPLWRVRPQLYAHAGFYTDPWDKKEYVGGMMALEVISPIDLGFQLEFSYSWANLRYTVADFEQFNPGLALFYAVEDMDIWFHYSALIGNDDAQGRGHVISFFFSHLWDIGVGLGGEIDGGIYNDFQTFQLSAELSYTPVEWFTLRVVPMLQMRFGDVQRQAGGPQGVLDRKVHGSGELSFDFSSEYINASLSGFYGTRWFTVENRGLMVWNSDDEIIGGFRLQTTLIPNLIASPYLSMRFDVAEYQYGLSHDFYILGFIAGLSVAF